jgi:hypothetical protein
MTRAPVDNPDEIRVGPRGSELIQNDEIAWLDNPEVTTPKAKSPRDILAQPYIVRILGRASTPNPLRD